MSLVLGALLVAASTVRYPSLLCEVPNPVVLGVVLLSTFFALVVRS